MCIINNETTIVKISARTKIENKSSTRIIHINKTTSTINNIKNKFSAVAEESFISLLGKIYARGIILSKNLFIYGEQERGFNFLTGPDTEKTLKIEEIIDTKEGKEILAEEIGQLGLHRNQTSLLTDLANFFLSAHITYNKTEAEARNEKARHSIETIFYPINKGNAIIRKRNEANKEALDYINVINFFCNYNNVYLSPSFKFGIALISNDAIFPAIYS